MKRLLVLSGLVLGLAGCRKNYTCVCGDSSNNIRTVVFQTTDTRKNAQTQCEEYRKSVYGIPDLVCEIR